MKDPIKRGFSFGLTSGIITTLGLIVGLNSSTHSKLVIIGGILTIAIADAFSDSLGMHISTESGNNSKRKNIWESTIATFLAKLVFALTFIIPIILFNLSLAILVSIIWGLFILGIFSFYIAKHRKAEPWKAVLEHLTITLIVIIITNYVGKIVSIYFG